MSINRVHSRMIILCIGVMLTGTRAFAFEPPAASELGDTALNDRLFQLSPEDPVAFEMLQDEVANLEANAEVSNFRQPSVFRLRPLYWTPELDGTMSLDDMFGFGTRLDFGNDLGVDDPDGNFAGEIGIHLGALQLRLSGFSIESDAVVTADQSITFGGVTVSPGDFVRTDIDIQNYKLLLGWSLLNPVDHGIGLTLSGGIDWYQVEATVEDVMSSSSDQIDEDLPIPVMGMHLEVPLDSLLISVDVSGLSVEVDDVEVDYLDISASLAWMPFPGVAVVGGYRLIDADLTVSDYHFDATLEGPFFGMEIRF